MSRPKVNSNIYMRISIKVIPRSSQSKIQIQPDGSLKVKLKNSPVFGRANDELVKLLAEYYQISKSQIEITKGAKAKNKIINVKNYESKIG